MAANTSHRRALVTGATAGIGLSFARLLAREGYDLILTARDADRLNQRREELLATFPHLDIEVISADLALEEGIQRIEKVLSAGINVLINNAGYGINKSFQKSSLESERDLLSVLVTAPLRLTHTALSRAGAADQQSQDLWIINVSSIAGWIAGGSYSAAKSYLTVLSESLHTELTGSNIRVMALCPGFTRTEFHQRGNMRISGIPNSLWMTADEVATTAWRDLRRGRAVSIPGWHYRIISFIARFAPRPWVRRIGMGLRSKQR